MSEALLRWAGIGLLLVAVVGCSGVRVRTDFDDSVSFEAMQRYAWVEPPEYERNDPFADNGLLRKRLREAIHTELATRGYRFVEEPAEADFLITYSVVLDDRLRVEGGSGYVGDGYYYGHRGYGSVYSSPSVRNYQESTLVIDVLEPEESGLVWRGWASGVVGTRDRNRSNETLERGVRRILSRFPPPPPDSA